MILKPFWGIESGVPEYAQTRVKLYEFSMGMQLEHTKRTIELAAPTQIEILYVLSMPCLRFPYFDTPPWTKYKIVASKEDRQLDFDKM